MYFLDVICTERQRRIRIPGACVRGFLSTDNPRADSAYLPSFSVRVPDARADILVATSRTKIVRLCIGLRLQRSSTQPHLTHACQGAFYTSIAYCALYNCCIATFQD